MERDEFQGRHILIVEDEFLIAEDLDERFTELGADVVGPAASVDYALDLIGSTPRLDGALVDVNLGGKLAYPVMDALDARNVPFVLMSGYEDRLLRKRYPRAQSCQKPYEFAELKRALIAALPV